MVHYSSLAVSAWMTLASTSVFASQDSSYYPGFTNPNVKKYDMYYRDAINVIQDIAAGEFSKLFIQYHGCVWSEYGNGSDEVDIGCSAAADNGNDEDGNGMSPWYLGRTQCYRANAAYSLYGIKGMQSSGDSSEGSPCTKKHYINTFFTTYGVESFGDPLGIDYDSYGASSYCSSNENGEDKDENNGEEDEGGQEQAEGEQNGYQHGSKLYSGYTSYGTGCSADGQFVMAKFNGAFCDGSQFMATRDAFENLNEYFDDLSCQQVYDSSDMDSYEAAAAGGGQGQENNYWDDISGSSTIAFQLLSYSSACSVTEYPNGRCPDPHGVKARRDKALYHKARRVFRKVPLFLPILTGAFGFAALLLFCLTWRTSVSTKWRRRHGDRMTRVRSQEGTGQKGRLIQPDNVEEDKSWLDHVAATMSRTTSAISQQSEILKERLQSYAEEEDDDDNEAPAEAEATDPEAQVGDYVSPIIDTSAATSAVTKKETAEDTMKEETEEDTMKEETEEDTMKEEKTESEDIEEPTLKDGELTDPKQSESNVNKDVLEQDPSQSEKSTVEENKLIADQSEDREEPNASKDQKEEPSITKDGETDAFTTDQVDCKAGNADVNETVASPPQTSSARNKKKYKRPKLAKISKWIFGKKKAKK